MKNRVNLQYEKDITDSSFGDSCLTCILKDDRGKESILT
jgi:hypothetical protein